MPLPSSNQTLYSELFQFPASDLEFIFDHVRQDVTLFDGSRILLTGATGFLGKWILAALLFSQKRLGISFEILALTRNKEKFLKQFPVLLDYKNLTLIEGDIQDFIFPKGPIDLIVHGATDTSLEAARKPTQLVDSIVLGTRHILKLADIKKTRRIVYLSSGAIYGKQPESIEHIPEDYPGSLNPMDISSSYGEAKRLAEHYCVLAGEKHEIDIAIARGFAFVGPGMPINGHFAIGNFILDAISGKKIHIKGDGSPIRSYLYAADAAIWILRMLIRGNGVRAYNLGSDNPIKIYELAKYVIEALEKNVEIELSTNPERNMHRNSYIPDINRSKSELGVAVWTDLRSAIRRTGLWNQSYTSLKNL